MSKGIIKKVAGPLVIAEGMRDAFYSVIIRKQVMRGHEQRYN